MPYEYEYGLFIFSLFYNNNIGKFSSHFVTTQSILSEFIQECNSISCVFPIMTGMFVFSVNDCIAHVFAFSYSHSRWIFSGIRAKASGTSICASPYGFHIHSEDCGVTGRGR